MQLILVIIGCLLAVCQSVVGQGKFKTCSKRVILSDTGCRDASGEILTGCGSPSQDLLRATSDGDMAAVQSLLRCPGVDVNVQDAANYGYTPLINAARNGDRQMVQVGKFDLRGWVKNSASGCEDLSGRSRQKGKQ